MFYIEGIEVAALAAQGRSVEIADRRGHGPVTHGQLTELLHMLEAIGIVKVGRPPVAAPAPVAPPQPVPQPGAAAAPQVVAQAAAGEPAPAAAAAAPAAEVATAS